MEKKIASLSQKTDDKLLKAKRELEFLEEDFRKAEQKYKEQKAACQKRIDELEKQVHDERSKKIGKKMSELNIDMNWFYAQMENKDSDLFRLLASMEEEKKESVTEEPEEAEEETDEEDEES